MVIDISEQITLRHQETRLVAYPVLVRTIYEEQRTPIEDLWRETLDLHVLKQKRKSLRNRIRVDRDRLNPFRPEQTR